MSLLGQVVDYYKNGVSAALTTLRTDLGTGKIWDDFAPGYQADGTTALQRPYIVLSEESARLVDGTVSGTRLIEVVVAFDIFTVGRAQGELIANDIVAAYEGQAMTASGNETFLAFIYENRSISYDGEGWSTLLQLRCKKHYTLS